MKRNIVELLGTLVFILIAWLSNDPLAIGVGYLVILCITLPFSNGYLNPAVTLAMRAQKKITMDSAIQYWVAQIIGGTLWALLVRFFQWSPMLIMPVDGVSMWKIAIAEGLFTFLLSVSAIVMMKKYEEKQLSAMVLGLILFVAIMSVWKITGGIFNPALAIGGSFVDWIHGWESWMFLWMYLISTLVGWFIGGKFVDMKYDKI